MRIADAFTLYGIDAHSGAVQQYIHNMVIQQVNFVHIKDITVGLRQQTGLKNFFTLFDGLLHVERTNHPVFGRTDG